MLKRTISLLLCLCLLLCCAPMVSADELGSGTCGDNLTWVLTRVYDQGVIHETLTISGTGDMYDFDSDNCAPWLDNNSNRYYIDSVVFNGNITSIGSRAFYNCSALTNVSLPANVTRIGDSAFSGCAALTSVTIPNGVTSIGAHAFQSCVKLSSIVIPDSVTSMGNQAFEMCSELTSVTIGDGLSTIGENAFYNCRKLANLTIGNNVSEIGYTAFYSCDGLTDVVIPDSVSTIGPRAFSYCENLTSVVIGSGVKEFSNAFQYCPNLVTVIIRDGVTSVSDNAFYNCTGLTNISLPDSITSIGVSSFSNCTSLAEVTLPESITSIGRSAFNGCTALTSVTIPANVTNLDGHTFYNCTSLKTVTLSANLKYIQPYAFWGCKRLTKVVIPGSVTYIGGYAFDECTSLVGVYFGGTQEQWNAITIGSGNDPLVNATIHYNSSLSITRQPSNQSVTEGKTAKFTVEAAGDGLTYQWQYRTSTSGSWKNSTAASAVTATVKVTGKASRNGYQYRCVITDSAGNVVESAPAPLYVLGVTTQPSNQSVKADKTATFKVKATGDGLTYQWQYRTSTNGKWKNSTASTATTATVKVTGKTSRNGYQYRCKVTDSAGNVVYSDPATLTVLSGVSVTSQPADAHIVTGDTAKFKVKATGDGLTYQWQYRTSSSGSWKNSTASSAVTATVKVTGKTSRNGYQYRCKITDSAGNTVYSDPATLYVLGVTTQPSSKTVSAGTTVKFTVKATGDGLTYQWQYRTSSSGTWKNSGASTATKATIKINGTTSKNGYQYRCVITDSAGNVVYSSPATLTVK